MTKSQNTKRIGNRKSQKAAAQTELPQQNTQHVKMCKQNKKLKTINKQMKTSNKTHILDMQTHHTQWMTKLQNNKTISNRKSQNVVAQTETEWTDLVNTQITKTNKLHNKIRKNSLKKTLQKQKKRTTCVN